MWKSFGITSLSLWVSELLLLLVMNYLATNRLISGPSSNAPLFHHLKKVRDDKIQKRVNALNSSYQNVHSAHTLKFWRLWWTFWRRWLSTAAPSDRLLEQISELWARVFPEALIPFDFTLDSAADRKAPTLPSDSNTLMLQLIAILCNRVHQNTSKHLAAKNQWCLKVNLLCTWPSSYKL